MRPTEFRATADALTTSLQEVLERRAYRDYTVVTDDSSPNGQYWQISLEYYSGETSDNAVRKPLLRFQDADGSAVGHGEISRFFRRDDDLLAELHTMVDSGALSPVEKILRSSASGLTEEESLVLQVDALFGEGGRHDQDLLEELVAIIHDYRGSLVCETMLGERKWVTAVDESGHEIRYRLPFEKERYLKRVIKHTSPGEADGQPYVFVLMSFKETPYLTDAYGAIRRAVADWNENAKVERVDEIQDDFRITDKIHECIERADFVVADLTGERPNVYYEVGYARGREKRMVHTAREGTSLHFDLKDFNTIFWDSAEKLQASLTRRLRGMTRRAPL